MFKIESIRRNDDSKEAVVICNGEYFRITVHDLDMLAVEGQCEIDEETFELLNQAVVRLSCIKKAFDFLSYGDLTEKQLRDKLSRKFDKELSADVAQLFVERGYVDDLRIAERYAETFYEFKNMGFNRIKAELYRRGVSKENIDIVLSKYENEDQCERIEEFVRKKYDVSRSGDVAYRRKVYVGAIRAGFSGSDIGDFLRNFESEF